MAFEPKYTPEQRGALAFAYLERGTPAPTVAAMAAAGKLPDPGGQLLPAFEVPEHSVRTIAKRAHKAAMRRYARAVEAPAVDAVEQFRRRLVAVIEAELTKAEMTARSGIVAKGSPERLRQIARAVRELAAIPGPMEPRPPAPGAKRGGIRNGGETRGGIAGQLLAELAAQRPGWSTAEGSNVALEGAAR